MAYVFYRYTSNYLAMKRSEQLFSLRKQNERLKIVVSELLAQVNDIDQESKFRNSNVHPSHSQQMVLSCNELVSLGDTLKLIDRHLQSGQVRESRKYILDSCNIALRASNDLHSLRTLKGTK